ncbi:MAG: hypothetical protein M1817_003935 [Caeruleum heppii]|nr:MAG: hypothetical protein M1817_003935 [Caeruleum heppii]
MALIQNLMPPSRENWERIVWAWQFFPLFTVVQWLSDYYPQGKTSVESRFNVPGKIGWTIMEAPGLITLLYIVFTLPQEANLTAPLPNVNYLMAALFTIHYTYRAVLAPLVLNPSMSPMHPSVVVSGLAFQLINATSIGGWIGGYGPVTADDWAGQVLRVEIGLIIWGFGFLGNVFHDDELREIRRAAARTQVKREQAQDEKGRSTKSVDKVYMLPENGLFRFIFFPHYLCEWIEWAGFWVIGGLGCIPARSFLLNEITTMTPRALQGKRWYVERFGKEKTAGRMAIIRGLL